MGLRLSVVDYRTSVQRSFYVQAIREKRQRGHQGRWGREGKSGEEKKDIEKEIHYLSITIVDYRRSQRRATVGIAIIVVVDAAATVVIITDGVLGIGDTSIARWRC